MTEASILNVKTPIKQTITKEINGPWTSKIQIEADDYISGEGYTTIDDELYIVKKLQKIKNRGKIYFDVDLDHNMSELSNATIERLDRKSVV